MSENRFLEDEYISNTNNSNKIFPSTRYQGSKLKISDWIMTIIKDLNFNTCLEVLPTLERESINLVVTIDK